MLKIIRADFYRLFHSKVFIILQIMFLMYIVDSVRTEFVGSVVFNGTVISNLRDTSLQPNWTGAVALIGMSSHGEIFLYFCLPLLVILIGSDVTHKTYRNLLTVGASRLRYFLSKNMMLWIACLM